MNHHQKHRSASLLAMAALLSAAPIQGAWAQTAPTLGSASGFAVLGGAGVTCTVRSEPIAPVIVESVQVTPAPPRTTKLDADPSVGALCANAAWVSSASKQAEKYF